MFLFSIVFPDKMNFNLITAFIVVSAFGFVTADIFETNKAAAFNKQACETR